MLYGLHMDGSPHPILVKEGSHSGILIQCEMFVQIDLGDYLRVKHRKCPDPKMKLVGIQEDVHLYGSNTFGKLGQMLTKIHSTSKEKEYVFPSYDTTNISDTGDLFVYGLCPFRYISIYTNGSVVLQKMKFHLME
jgi:hypothetical protein